ncbi:AAA family ATPase [Azospirillum halopraeferens]|uniref:AAA family ATPase n=1 Tax=Azospirillum halopraeferens TaxID=34010 RepID=UPI000491BAC1|nr:AAA family ATPase [Azospirillum halopraeferens]
MLTELTIRNFKTLEDVTIELGDRVILIGPNNSGKTTALQALALWDIGVGSEFGAGRHSRDGVPGLPPARGLMLQACPRR